ncbi:MAG: shikimate dehydrogenase [Gammaproteobacteria bacterium]|nr:shikimate dehydrogenase [Gammaproteobacteria bacterium]MBQ0840901.1 shikimate dehydrogenase [Gammaproteobacteria bacterium]
MTDQYAVFGNPIKHSRSPQIHRAFADQTGQDINYVSTLVAPEQFQSAASNFFKNAGKGLNITVPFKQDAFAFADELSERARRAGAVNTLIHQKDGSVLGDNTDGVGLVRDISINLGWAITGKKILLVGAGGAAMGVLEPLLKKYPSLIVIANRTANKALKLANDFAALGNIEGCGFDDLKDSGHFDLIINATSASLAGEIAALPSHVLTPNTQGYDMMYAAEPTPFMRWMNEQGAQQTADGLGMLVEQAAESFTLWRGVQPQTQPVIAAIRAEMSA